MSGAVDVPSSVFVVLDELGAPIYCAAYPQDCHDHISDAIVEGGLVEAAGWVVREYVGPAKAVER